MMARMSPDSQPGGQVRGWHVVSNVAGHGRSLNEVDLKTPGRIKQLKDSSLEQVLLKMVSFQNGVKESFLKQDDSGRQGDHLARSNFSLERKGKVEGGKGMPRDEHTTASLEGYKSVPSAFSGGNFLKQCEELTTWTNGILRDHGERPITDLRKRISDGVTLVQLLEILGHDKIQGIHPVPTTANQKTENLRQCVSYLDLKGGDTHGINQQELADGNLKSTLMFMNSVRKRYDPQFAPREMADGASQQGQISSRPGSAHARFPPDPEPPPPLPPGPKPGYRSHSGPPVVMRRDVANGSGSDLLPGTLGRQEEEGRPPAPPPPNIVSTTELDRNSASQRGVEERRSYLPHSSSSRVDGPPPLRPRSAKPAPTSTPPPPPTQATQAWTSNSSSGNTPKLPPKQFGNQEVREAVSHTVEERLKSLLGSPGGPQKNGVQGQPDGYQSHRPPPPPQQGHVNGGYQYDDGELLVPPPRKSTDYGRRDSLDGYHNQDSHKAQGSISNEGELQISYVPSRPSERMPGVSRGQALHNNKPNPPGSAANRGPSPGPPLPPKSVGQPPRYQPPPQYSPYLRRSGGAPPPPPPNNGTNAPGNSSALRNVCNKLYTRDSNPPYNNPQQQGPPSPYGSQPQTWNKYGANAPTSTSQGQPRTSPMGQSSSGTASQTSGQGSNSHSPSSPGSRPNPNQHQGPYQPHPGSSEQGGKPNNERRLSGDHRAPYHYDVQSRMQQDNRLSGSSSSTEPKSPYERPPTVLHGTAGQRATNSLSVNDHYGSTISAQEPKDSNPSNRNKQTSYSHTIPMKEQTGKFEAGPSNRDSSALLRGASHPGPKSDNIELMAMNNAKRLSGSGDLNGKLGISNSRGMANDSASAMAHQASQMALKPNPKWRDSLASDDGNYSPSISSSRSVTPPLPPLSPDNTPPHTPPDSPSLPRHSQHHRPGNAPGFLARTPDVVTSTAKKVPSVTAGKKKAGRKTSGAPLSVKTWDGRSKRTFTGGSNKRITMGKPPRPPTAAMNGQHGSGDDDSADQDTATNTSFTEADYATVNGTGTGPLEAHEARIIRQQLEGLETMYHEILKLLGLDREFIPGSRRSISSTSSISRSGRPRMKRSHSAQHRSRDLKQVNKRFARLESHVVTLARSVAHLSSEMRNHNGLYTDVEDIKREMGRVKEMVQARNHQTNPLSDWERFRGWVPSLTNPKRVNKLTKFFGQEPPLLHIFLKKLGYEKYVTNFEQEKIGMIELPYMNEDRLQRIGIPMGPRLRILQEAQLCFRQENFDIYIV